MGVRIVKMLRTAARRAAAPLSRRFHATSKASMQIPGEAHHTEHAIQATADWKKYSKFFAMGLSGVMVLEFFVHLSHAGHHHETEVYPFRKIATSLSPGVMASTLSSVPPSMMSNKHHLLG